MLDWVVILTPIVALGALLLLGFAGCDVVLGLEEITVVEAKVRVPATLSVTEILYGWTKPDGTTTQFLADHPTPGTTDGSDAVFTHYLSDVVTGAWTVRCRVTVNGAMAMQATAQGIFTVDGTDTFVDATFQGSVSGGVFSIAFVGAS